MLGWSGGATGTGILSNPITMNAPVTATAIWSTSGGGGSGPADYSVTLHGPYYEDGTAAAYECLLQSVLRMVQSTRSS